MQKKTNTREVFTIIGNFLSSTLVAFVALLAVVLVVIRALGMQFFTVESGSMSPLYPMNSLVVVREVAPETIEVGDVVTYVLNEDLVLVTHRVTEINASERTFTTKGDANTAEDPNPVLWDNVVGKVVLGLPGVGAPVAYLTNAENRPVVVGALVALGVVSLVWDLLARRARKRQKVRRTDESIVRLDELPGESACQNKQDAPPDKSP